jgi:hypothetical protein
VIQTYNGIEIFRAVSNFAIKDKRVINTQNKFIANVSGRSIPLIRLFQQLRLCLKLICNWITNTNPNFTAEKLVSINTKLQITFVIMGHWGWYTTKRQVIIYHWLGIYFWITKSRPHVSENWCLNGIVLKMIWLFHANLIDIPYAHEEAGSESWFTSLIILISKFIHHLLIRLSAVNIE